MVDKEKITLELLENQEMYRSLFENSSDPIFIMDLEGNHLQVNQKAADLLGYTTDELVKLGRDAIVFEDEIGQSTMVLQNLLDGQTFPPYERTFIHKNGSRICMEVNATIIEDKFGNAQFIQSVARDVSFRKEKESQIELQFKRLSSLRKIDRMVSKNLDLFLTLDILVREVIDQLNVDAADVLLINKQTGTLKFESGFGLQSSCYSNHGNCSGRGLIGQSCAGTPDAPVCAQRPGC